MEKFLAYKNEYKRCEQVSIIIPVILVTIPVIIGIIAVCINFLGQADTTYSYSTNSTINSSIAAAFVNIFFRMKSRKIHSTVLHLYGVDLDDKEAVKEKLKELKFA